MIIKNNVLVTYGDMESHHVLKLEIKRKIKDFLVVQWLKLGPVKGMLAQDPWLGN